MESVGDIQKPNDFGVKFMAILITALVCTSVMGFIVPPIWRVDEMNCSIKHGIITDKGLVSHCMGELCYNEYWVKVDNDTVWVSPATYILYGTGDRFDWPVC